MRKGEAGSKRKKGECILKEVWYKQKVEERCIKCGWSNPQALDCEATARVKLHPFPSNLN